MHYTEFQKVATKVGLKMVGENTTCHNIGPFRISHIQVGITEHNCKACWNFVKRWLGKDTEFGKHSVIYTIQLTTGVSQYKNLCDWTFKYSIVTEDMKALLVKKPGAGNFKKGAKVKKLPLTPKQIAAEKEATARWEVDLEI